MYTFQVNHTTIRSESDLNSLSDKSLNGQRTVINKTRPMNFQFRKQLKGAKSFQDEQIQELPQSRQIPLISKEFKHQKLQIRSSTIKHQHREMDSISEQVSNENVSNNSPILITIKSSSEDNSANSKRLLQDQNIDSAPTSDVIDFNHCGNKFPFNFNDAYAQQTGVDDAYTIFKKVHNNVETQLEQISQGSDTFIDDLLSYNGDILEDYSYHTKQSQVFSGSTYNQIRPRSKRYQKSSIQSEVNLRKSSFQKELGSPLPDNQILLPFQRQRKLTTNTKQGTASSRKSVVLHRKQPSESCIPQDILDSCDNHMSAQTYKNLTLQIFHQINYIKQIDRLPQIYDDQIIQFKYKKPGFNKLLIIDLDQTLINCHRRKQNQSNTSSEEENQDQSFEPQQNQVPLIPIQFVDTETGQVFKTEFSIRPFAIDFLRQANQRFEVAIFTAGFDWYANPILDKLDPDGELIQHRFFRNHCTYVEEQGFYVKDLRIFKGLDLKDALIIDDNVYSFAFHLDNGVPIVPFFGDKEDKEMIKVIKYLKSIQDKDDLRIINNKVFQLKKILRSNISNFIKYYDLDVISEQQKKEDEKSIDREQSILLQQNQPCNEILSNVQQEDENNSMTVEILDNILIDDKSYFNNNDGKECLTAELNKRSFLSQTKNIFRSQNDEELENDFFDEMQNHHNQTTLENEESERREKSFHSYPSKKLQQKVGIKKAISSISLMSQHLLHYVPQLKSQSLIQEEIQSFIKPPKRTNDNQLSKQTTQFSKNISTVSKSIESDLDNWQKAYQKICKNGNINDLIRFSQLDKLSNNSKQNKQLYMQKHFSYPNVSNVPQQTRNKRLHSE
ncbi:nli interacting factor-like phosphatase family protein [Stylonychia lemnae]|uniref:Nli interacting factor-like phosphatase family protein n=1 Tax=Stylonychia lemnae TaxID=5949 RepID=A0A077ZYN2_STYLE|nr:nli interacting factor-like phosphatase family protein [Stylonychia lemnae]|eukprot:CDW74995.1 nli interacting factor-like phosphatase family protein [Stylonychia lemnae]